MHISLRSGILLGLFGGLLSSVALADIPPPPTIKPTPANVPAPPVPAVKPATTKVVSKQTAPLSVNHVDLAKEGKGVQAKIVIPRKFLADLAPAAAPEPRASLGDPRSIVAGLMLSMAAVSLVFVARGSRLAKATAAAGVIAAVALVAAPLMADLRVPGQPYKGPARRPDDKPVGSTAVIEIVDEGDKITLELPIK